MLQVGDKVEWVKPNPQFRDWYGTVVAVDEAIGKASVAWLLLSGQPKAPKWEPFSDLTWIEEFPTVERKSHVRKANITDDVELPATYYEWHMDGKCYANGSTDFVGYSTLRPGAKVRIRLQKACEGCPVMLICRGEAIRTESLGWWGGMDQVDREEWVKTLMPKEEV